MNTKSSTLNAKSKDGKKEPLSIYIYYIISDDTLVIYGDRSQKLQRTSIFCATEVFNRKSKNIRFNLICNDQLITGNAEGLEPQLFTFTKAFVNLRGKPYLDFFFNSRSLGATLPEKMSCSLANGIDFISTTATLLLCDYTEFTTPDTRLRHRLLQEEALAKQYCETYLYENRNVGKLREVFDQRYGIVPL